MAYSGQLTEPYVLVIEQGGLRWTQTRAEVFKALKELNPRLRKTDWNVDGLPFNERFDEVVALVESIRAQGGAVVEVFEERLQLQHVWLSGGPPGTLRA